mmetsp:Transcript_103576/g.297634  ORF Transcript_103576/g.297634 Transcript_103576/m.297634 type:complete len:200 (-) Transcript_103576:72-671(-)
MPLALLTRMSPTKRSEVPWSVQNMGSYGAAEEDISPGWPTEHRASSRSSSGSTWLVSWFFSRSPIPEVRRPWAPAFWRISVAVYWLRISRRQYVLHWSCGVSAEQKSGTLMKPSRQRYSEVFNIWSLIPELFMKSLHFSESQPQWPPTMVCTRPVRNPLSAVNMAPIRVSWAVVWKFSHVGKLALPSANDQRVALCRST